MVVVHIGQSNLCRQKLTKEMIPEMSDFDFIFKADTLEILTLYAALTREVKYFESLESRPMSSRHLLFCHSSYLQDFGIFFCFILIESFITQKIANSAEFLERF